MADAVGVLNEFDVVMADHEGLLASAKEKLAIVERNYRRTLLINALNWRVLSEGKL